VAYPIIDPTTKKVTDMLAFIDTELEQKRKLLTEDLNRGTYFKFLESDYQKRMIEEYGDEIGYFGRIGPTME
jgi:hypothetical protein